MQEPSRGPGRYVVPAVLLAVGAVLGAVAFGEVVLAPNGGAEATSTPDSAQTVNTPTPGAPQDDTLVGTVEDVNPVFPLKDPHTTRYAHPEGKPPPQGDGSFERPWDLRSALSRANVKAGQEVSLRAGTYTPSEGSFTSDLVGTAEQPIVVRPYKGERVTIDRAGIEQGDAGVLNVTGRYAWYWGFEVTNSHPKRTTSFRGSRPDDLNRPDGIRVTGPNNKFINLLVHDNGDGFGFWGPATGSEIYGSLIYNNGWDGPTPPSPTPDDRAHGHGIYTQNNDADSPKAIRDNIVFNNFEYGIKVYTEGGAKIQGYAIEGNILAANGSYAHPNPDGRNLYIGSTKKENPAGSIVVAKNYAYQVSDRDGVDNVEIGHVGGNDDVTIQDNLFEGGKTVMWFGSWDSVTVTRNTLVGTSRDDGSKRLATLRTPTPPATTWTWESNTYHSDIMRPFRIGGDGVAWERWQLSTGYDASGAFSTRLPTRSLVEIRPNRYERGRANVLVVNRLERSVVRVDVSKVVEPGDSWELRNAQDYYGEPVVRGDNFDGAPITIPMSSLPAATPVGWTGAPAPAAGPGYGVFVLVAGGE